MKKFSKYFGPVLAAVIVLLAVWLLHNQFTVQDLKDIAANVQTRLAHRPWTILAAVAFAVTNYLVLIGYDLLAVRYLGINVPARKVAFGAFTSYACGFTFGATVAGTSVRYRLYSSWGVAGSKIVQLLIVLALTFWFGMLALAGTVFIFAPLDIPTALYLPLIGKITLPFHDTRPIGIVLLTVAVVYVGLSYFFEGSVPLWRWKLPVPPFGLTVCQVLIASLDLLLVAAVLYSLWPTSHPIGYFRVLDIYLFVFVLGVLTHAPGGYGVMEFILVSIIPENVRNEVVASWLLFRVIYNILPLFVAIAMLGWYEWRLFSRGAADRKDIPPLPSEL